MRHRLRVTSPSISRPDMHFAAPVLILLAALTIIACVLSKDVRAIVLRVLPQIVHRLLGRVL